MNSYNDKHYPFSGEIYAFSSRLFRVDGNRMPYAWNHTITYDPALGKMPFLVQRLYAEGMEVNVEPGEEDVRFQLYASIAPGELMFQFLVSIAPGELIFQDCTR